MYFPKFTVFLSIFFILLINVISTSKPNKPNDIDDLKKSQNLTQQQQQKLSSEELAKLELEQFQLEMADFIREEAEKDNMRAAHEDGQHHHHRGKRTVLFNTEAPIDVAMLFGIPITVLLPVLTNIFTNLNWSKIFKWKRSIDENEEEEEFVEESVLVQPHLDRLNGYFELLKIPERSCQQRAICELSANPSKYYPVSELVLNRIRDTLLPPMDYYLEDGNNSGFSYSLLQEIEPVPKNETGSPVHQQGNPNYTRPGQGKPKSLFQMYSKAADKGLAYGSNICTNEFGKKCPYSIDQRLNMPVLQFWNLLASLLKFTIKDNVNVNSF